MSKKLTIEYVREQFEKEGYILLAKEYVNNRSKLQYKCPKNHKHNISWRSWVSGSRCFYCNVENQKWRLQDIEKSFKAEGYTLLSKIYINTDTKLKLLCPNKHIYTISWHQWQGGTRCSKCNGNAKYDVTMVRNAFKNEGYTLISNTYINSTTLLDYICNSGNIGKITFGAWNSGHRCACCFGNKKLDIEKVKDSFNKKGYILLSIDYINAHTKLEYMCPKGHKHTIKWNDWQQGAECPTCYRLNNIGENHPSWKGGVSFEPYCEAWKDQEYKQDIRDRDNNKCLNPYCDSPNRNDLTIHHIDYDKKNCKPSNLITICRSCNGKANKDREWHKNWYEAIIKNRYQIGA